MAIHLLASFFKILVARSGYSLDFGEKCKFVTWETYENRDNGLSPRIFLQYLICALNMEDIASYPHIPACPAGSELLQFMQNSNRFGGWSSAAGAEQDISDMDSLARVNMVYSSG